METLLTRRHESPLGPLTIVVSPRGLRALLWDDEREGRVRLAPAVPGVAPLLDRTARELDEYFAGRRTTFELPLDPVGTPFQRRAWEALRRIPYGQTLGYGEQARLLGDGKAARAVGAANGRNPIAIVVPCHRVIGKDGSLTGFAAGLHRKRWLLDFETGSAGRFDEAQAHFREHAL